MLIVVMDTASHNDYHATISILLSRTICILLSVRQRSITTIVVVIANIKYHNLVHGNHHDKLEAR